MGATALMTMAACPGIKMWCIQESEQPRAPQHSAFSLERKFLLRQGPEEFVFVRK